MNSTGSGLWNLQGSNSMKLTVKKEFSPLKRVYSVSAAQAGTILRMKTKYPLPRDGASCWCSWFVTDTQDQPVAELYFYDVKYTKAWVEVRTLQEPVVRVGISSRFSRSVLILDENDQEVLKLKPCKLINQYKILDPEKEEVGNLTKEGWELNNEYTLTFLPILPMRFKMALLAAIIYTDNMEKKASNRLIKLKLFQ